MTKVINLIGGPGIGKSTIAAGLFYKMKRKGYSVEIIYEYTKEKIWEESFQTLEDEIYLFAKQLHKQWRLENKVDFIIVDHPLFNSAIYDGAKSGLYFKDFVLEQYNRFNNLNFFINRNVLYETNGRVQTEKDAIELDKNILKFMKENNITYTRLDVDNAIDNIIKEL